LDDADRASSRDDKTNVLVDFTLSLFQSRYNQYFLINFIVFFFQNVNAITM
jgi:hypothetical protein